VTKRLPSHRKLRTIPAQFVPNFLETLDQRFAPSIAAKRTYTELVNALGGEEHLSPQRRLLIERATWTSLILAKIEVDFATSGKVNLSDYTQATHALVSLFKTLGLNRVPVNVPSLHEYLEPRRKDA
jgi:hypothetical protein